MACGDCVQKLVLNLIENHRRHLDLIRAYELAERAVECVEARQRSEDPYAPNPCSIVGNCSGQYYDYSTCGTVSSPVPNSTLVCYCCNNSKCTSRTFYYTCNSGNKWNGSACVLPSVAAARGDGSTRIMTMPKKNLARKLEKTGELD
ncbi:MAG: hypothetical protein WCD81_06800 [Candidatus Bathyarchaeia archaeon]